MAAVPPTHATVGLTEGSICALCGDVLVPQEAVPALGHVEKVIQPGTAPTCLFPGTSDATACDRCGTVLQNVLAVPPLGHAYENGKCIRCGASQWIPETGDTSNIFLWAGIMVMSVIVLILLLFWMRRKKNEVDNSK